MLWNAELYSVVEYIRCVVLSGNVGVYRVSGVLDGSPAEAFAARAAAAAAAAAAVAVAAAAAARPGVAGADGEVTEAAR